MLSILKTHWKKKESILINSNKIEHIFFSVLEDLKDFLGDLTLVGGWMPYIYSNYVWKNYVQNPVTTVDIDFGLNDSISRDYSKTIFQTLSSLSYSERHSRMDRMFPVVLYKEGKVPVEFITYPEAKRDIVEKLLGEQMQVNKLDKFDFLMKHTVSVHVQAKEQNKGYIINCPKPSAFLYHKGATFIDRENEDKQAKDLYYMYFILRYTPGIDMILKEVAQYKQEGHFKEVSKNLNMFFERISSSGCIMVEKENGIDEFIVDLRQDIFDRFQRLKSVLSDLESEMRADGSPR